MKPSSDLHRPPLLREQVFGSPGAAEWFRAAPAPFELSPWLWLAMAFLGTTVLISIAVFREHTQSRRYAGSATHCASRCGIRVDLAAALDRQLALRPGDHVLLYGPSGQHGAGEVLAVVPARSGRARIELAVTPGLHVTGPVVLKATVTRPLYQWILPGTGRR